MKSVHYRKSVWKKTKEEVCTLQKNCNNLFTLYEAFQACHEIFPDVAIVLEIIRCVPQVERRRKRISVNEFYYE